MHQEILNSNQKELLPIVDSFKNEFVLVDGTALALQIGHRQSIDFDLFTSGPFNFEEIVQKLQAKKILNRVLVSSSRELTLMANNVKMTWHTFPYPIEGSVQCDFARLPNPVVLGAMKLFALNGRAKWKDYVDLYILMKHQNYTLPEMMSKASQLFGSAFSEKLIRVQLSYFDDVSFAETVTWMPGWETKEDDIKQYLTQVSLQ